MKAAASHSGIPLVAQEVANDDTKEDDTPPPGGKLQDFPAIGSSGKLQDFTATGSSGSL
eukprot:CAMPEP_0172685808 /NCGR_PEP_ID=MMETSP1074-20121228/20504_1 /TAXON_ID=2916 /ORGANISM="Ceratium fusus, Strain PA161109" /LENGTH=58 /DNA_ID=CAMNT_0013505023 /DNA_START=1104 /DNA_END=1281 /DNA_ORIENTATION=+